MTDAQREKLIQTLTNCADDPMWADHAEISKASALAELLKEVLADSCQAEGETNLSSDHYRRLYEALASMQAPAAPGSTQQARIGEYPVWREQMQQAPDRIEWNTPPNLEAKIDALQAPEPAGVYAEMPEKRALPVIGSGFANHARGFTTDQMRAFADATCALRAGRDAEDWVSPLDRVPEADTPVIVWSQQAWEKEPSAKIDEWSMQREAPLSFSTATIATGFGWNDHNDFQSVIAWKPIKPPADAARKATGEAS